MKKTKIILSLILVTFTIILSLYVVSSMTVASIDIQTDIDTGKCYIGPSYNTEVPCNYNGEIITDVDTGKCFAGPDNRIEVPCNIITNSSGGGTTTGGTSDAKTILSQGKPGEIMNILKWVVNILSGAVMVVAVIMLIIGAIQYSSAGGEPNRVKAAKTKITNVLIGIVAYVFLYAFLQWLIPGGVFK